MLLSTGLRLLARGSTNGSAEGDGSANGVRAGGGKHASTRMRAPSARTQRRPARFGLVVTMESQPSIRCAGGRFVTGGDADAPAGWLGGGESIAWLADGKTGSCIIARTVSMSPESCLIACWRGVCSFAVVVPPCTNFCNDWNTCGCVGAVGRMDENRPRGVHPYAPTVARAGSSVVSSCSIACDTLRSCPSSMKRVRRCVTCSSDSTLSYPSRK